MKVTFTTSRRVITFVVCTVFIELVTRIKQQLNGLIFQRQNASECIPTGQHATGMLLASLTEDDAVPIENRSGHTLFVMVERTVEVMRQEDRGAGDPPKG